MIYVLLPMAMSLSGCAEASMQTRAVGMIVYGLAVMAISAAGLLYRGVRS